VTVNLLIRDSLCSGALFTPSKIHVVTQCKPIQPHKMGSTNTTYPILLSDSL
jgi:hypothetical protein